MKNADFGSCRELLLAPDRNLSHWNTFTLNSNLTDDLPPTNAPRSPDSTKEGNSKYSLFSRAVQNPGTAFSVVRAAIKGRIYWAYCFVAGRRFKVGRKFRVFGSLSIRGPGSVEFGDNVSVWQHVTPWTHSKGAVIRVGANTRLAGVRMGCAQLIDIGSDCIVAECRIMDTDFHSITADRHKDSAPVRTAPVRLGRNVWVAAQAGLLPGTTIGENSVVSFGSVCSGTFPSDVVIVGNPARVAGKLPVVSPA